MWTDYRLAWNFSDFDNTDYVHIHQSKMWTPDLILSNRWDYHRYVFLPITLTVKGKGKDIAVRNRNHHTATGNHVPYGITQCYLPPGSGDFLIFTPAEAGTRFSDMELIICCVTKSSRLLIIFLTINQLKYYLTET